MKIIKAPASAAAFSLLGVYKDKLTCVENGPHMKSLTVALFIIAKRLETT